MKRRRPNADREQQVNDEQLVPTSRKKCVQGVQTDPAELREEPALKRRQTQRSSCALRPSFRQHGVLRRVCGSDGQRIYALALMQGDSALVTWDCVLEAIENSRSAFEQYQALVVAESAMSHLGAQDVPRLLRALHTQMNGGWVNRSIERRKLAQRILVALGHDSGRLPS
ncbi:hypothetical protein AB0P05_35650 [Streptomyces flaveolus]|uniref:hypothetical protein n=1 Tax=Streptomyces flaveolus TaxID=67297 RepID=UPI00341403A7